LLLLLLAPLLTLLPQAAAALHRWAAAEGLASCMQQDAPTRGCLLQTMPAAGQ